MKNLPGLAAIVWLCCPGLAHAEPQEMVDGNVRAFLRTYCLRCHGPETQEADFRVDQLKVSTTANDAEYWQLVLGNLNLGEMPPEGETQPPIEELEPVTDWIAAELRRARRALSGRSGEVVLRRLNRTEYEYTIEDLFDVRGDFTTGFPDDATQHGFDNNGAALTLSATQIDSYLEAADFIINRAIQEGPRPETRQAVFTLHDLNQRAWDNHRRQVERRQKNFAELTPDEKERTREMVRQLQENPHAGFIFPVYEDGRVRAPTPEDGPEVDAVIATQYLNHAPGTRDFLRPRQAGWYRWKVVACAVRNEGNPVRMRIRYGSFGPAAIPQVADVVQLTGSTPQELEYRFYLQPHQEVRVEMLDGQRWARSEDKVDLPGPFIAIRSIEIEGPLFAQWPPRGHRTLLGTRDADSLQDDEMPAVLAELARRLFRRPVDEVVVQDFVAFYTSLRDQKLSPLESFKLTARAMMASPHFLYHVEVGASPDSYALANRLSYFLWRSVPDATLCELAADGSLARPEVLRQQVDRLLADERSDRFLNDFVGQWLDIDKVGEMQPDGNLYPEYDEQLERAMVEETRSFIREILHKDLSLANLIDSDWAMLNDRLAEHYGIDGVEGNAFRRVALHESDTVRGGLLTQASILNITSNGTTTSPVVRGVWVLERLLGRPAPPPPPDVPAIEPDIRGASTIQEQLERHRSIPQCAACHRRIDPYGFALENFDVIGGWRENYRALEPTANPNRPRLIDGPAVISSDRLPRQGDFRGFREFRRLLLQEEERVSENMAHQLATFALGRSMDFADEEDLQRIVATTRASGGGLKTMLRELVASELFRRP